MSWIVKYRIEYTSLFSKLKNKSHFFHAKKYLNDKKFEIKYIPTGNKFIPTVFLKQSNKYI